MNFFYTWQFFEVLFHWACTGEVKLEPGDRSVPQLWHQAIEFGAGEFQNALLDKVILELKTACPRKLFESAWPYFYSVGASNASLKFGMGKLCLDVMIHLAHHHQQLEYEVQGSLKMMMKKGAGPQDLHLEFAYALMEQKADDLPTLDIPPFEKDPSQYYIQVEEVVEEEDGDEKRTRKRANRAAIQGPILLTTPHIEKLTNFADPSLPLRGKTKDQSLYYVQVEDEEEEDNRG